MGEHVDIVRQLPGLRGGAWESSSAGSPENEAWDGVGELWFDDATSADIAFARSLSRAC